MRKFRKSSSEEKPAPRRFSREDAEAEAAEELRRVMERAGVAPGDGSPAPVPPGPAPRPADGPPMPPPSDPVVAVTVPEEVVVADGPGGAPPEAPAGDDIPPAAVRRVRKTPPAATARPGARAPGTGAGSETTGPRARRTRP